MQIYLLSLLFILNTTLDKTPNFYPNYIAAREASKNYNKDLLVFFSKNACADCDAAWTSFEKDPIASKLYISTSVNIQDFDGAVFLDKYGLRNAPAWLVLDPQGQVKDKWEGEWKKTPTRPATPKPEKADVQNTAKESPSKVADKETPNATPVMAEPETSTIAPAAAVASQKKAFVAEEEIPVVVEVQEEVVVEDVVIEEVVVEEVVVEEVAVEKIAVEKVLVEENETKQVVEESTIEIPVTEEEPTPETIQTEVSGFVIQAGFFGSEANAKGLVNDLNAKGFGNFSITPTVRNGTTFHRVISTSYSTEEEARIKAEDLQKADIKATIKNQKEI